jgi:PPOX class probable F420-dependent enzyme
VAQQDGGREELLAALGRGKYLSIETFKRDGTGVMTPVWFVVESDRVFCRSDPETHKMKRIRRNPDVTVAACNVRGTVKGPRMPARVELVPEPDWPRLDEAYDRKYRLEALLSKLPFGGPPGQTAGQVYYEILPEG